ncbi:unnamed protein product [Calypogeia fissa]
MEAAVLPCAAAVRASISLPTSIPLKLQQDHRASSSSMQLNGAGGAGGRKAFDDGLQQSIRHSRDRRSLVTRCMATLPAKIPDTALPRPFPGYVCVYARRSPYGTCGLFLTSLLMIPSVKDEHYFF